MTTTELQIECAKLDGWICKPSLKAIHPAPLAWWYHPLLHQEAVEIGYGYPDSEKLLPKYSVSYNAIIPLIQKCMADPDRQTSVNNTTRFGYALYNVLNIENPHALENYGWTWVKTIEATPTQLAIALLKATGRYKE